MRFPERYDIECFFRDHGAKLARGGAAAAVVAAMTVAGLWWFEWRVQPPPSIFDTPVDDVMAFFVSDDFNALPVKERMRLIGEFVKRFQNLNQSESAVLSAFMAGLTGKTMEQLRENVRLLARDVMKDGADQYFKLRPEERAAFMDQWIVDWMKFGERMESATGEERSDKTDEDRLAEVKRDGAQGRREMEEAGDPKMGERDAVRIVDFWRREVETVATPREQGQIMRFMQDLRKHVEQ